MTKRHDSASDDSATAEGTVASAGEALPQSVHVDEVRERVLPVDLDHGNALAVARLERRVGADVDELEMEAELRVERRHDLERAPAEAAVRGVEDPDRCYG